MGEFSYFITATDRSLLLDQSEAIFERVWRSDFSAPGFCVIDTGTIDSHTLRSWMVALKQRLGEIGERRGTGPFGYCSMGRFDQQVSTNFHRDGAPAESLLMLGYEPSNVRSRLLLADYSRVAFDLGMTPHRLLQDFNPMYKKGEALLADAITELPQPTEGHSRIVLINNSSLPFDASQANPLGVLHKAIIETPNDSERRIINSTMLAAKQSDLVSPADQRQFVATETISPKVY